MGFRPPQLYPLQVELDQGLSEAALRLETKNLPVKLVFEQAFSSYERSNRWTAAAADPVSGSSPNTFADAATNQRDERDARTSRLVATYSGGRFEVAASGLYRPAELDGPNVNSKTFEIAGGAFGTVGFVDEVIGSADMDTAAGDLRLGFQLAPSWRLRVSSTYRDTSTDASLIGARLLRITNVFGDTFDIPGTVDQRSRFDVTDQDHRIDLEWQRDSWSVWAGGLMATRDVKYQIGSHEEPFATERESDGALLGISYSPARGVDLSAEYEHGSFDRFVFRTEPETVDLLTLRLRSQIGRGWAVRAQARFEDGDNPAAVAALDHSSDASSAGVSWSAQDGTTGFGVDLHLFDIRTDTALELPGQVPGRSLYDLSLLTLTANGRASLGRVDLAGDLTRIDDDGDTWPVEAWTARARIAIEVAPKTAITFFGELWSYDEGRGELDDYDVTRYGIGFRRSFE